MYLIEVNLISYLKSIVNRIYWVLDSFSGVIKSLNRRAILVIYIFYNIVDYPIYFYWWLLFAPLGVLVKKFSFRKEVSKFAKNKILILYENNETYKIIAEKTGLTMGTIGSVLQKAGVIRKRKLAAFPVPDRDPNNPDFYGEGYWHMNLDLKSQSLGTVVRVTNRLNIEHSGHRGQPTKSSIAVG